MIEHDKRIKNGKKLKSNETGNPQTEVDRKTTASTMASNELDNEIHEDI